MKHADYFEKLENQSVQCQLCPHRCVIEIDNVGKCGVRKNQNGHLVAKTYGQVAAFGVDPIEKKPLFHFHPGSRVASFGSSGCNMSCEYCQNHSISQKVGVHVQTSPQDLVKKAYHEGNNIGLAATYNEPIIQYEFLMDVFELNKKCRRKNVLVTNGYIEPSPLSEMVTLVDAFNVDIKGFTDNFYHKVCGATLKPVMRAIEYIYDRSHLELTLLLLPGLNDDELSLQYLFESVQSISADIPLHVSRYFPSYKMTEPQTSLASLLATQEMALEYLNHVYIGNTLEVANETRCKSCGYTLVTRDRNGVALSVSDDRCPSCNRYHHLILD